MNDGKYLLFQLKRQSFENANKPITPDVQWIMDLESGGVRELSSSEIAVVDLRCPTSFWKIYFGPRENKVVGKQDPSITGPNGYTLRPVVGNGLIDEYRLERSGYSIRFTFSKLRIEFVREVAPIELPNARVFIVEPAQRLIIYTPSSKSNEPNIQLRDLQDPSIEVAKWNRHRQNIPFWDAESIYSISEDAKTMERRSLRTGRIEESIPVVLNLDPSLRVHHIDINRSLYLGTVQRNGQSGVIAANFLTGEEVAFLPNTLLRDFDSKSNCVLLESSNPYELSVYRLTSEKAVRLEEIDPNGILSLHLNPPESRAVAILKDGTVSIHHLPDGKVVRRFDSMSNHKSWWVVVTVSMISIWLTRLMVSGRHVGSNATLDTAILIFVVWTSLVALQQRTVLDYSLGYQIRCFAYGAVTATAIYLVDWLRRGSAGRMNRAIQWTFVLATLFAIHFVSKQYELIFPNRNFREILLTSIASLCVAIAIIGTITGIDTLRKRFFVANAVETQEKFQFETVDILWFAAAVAIACFVFGTLTRDQRIDWGWQLRILAAQSTVLSAGIVYISMLRQMFATLTDPTAKRRSRRIALMLALTVLFAAGVWIVGFYTHPLVNVRSAVFNLTAIEFCSWYSLGFFVMLSILLVRTDHPNRMTRRRVKS